MTATTRPLAGPTGLPVSPLVGRIAATRAVLGDRNATALASPASLGSPLGVVCAPAGLVTAPPVHRRAGRGDRLVSRDGAAAHGAGVALLAAHGGAGVTCLLRAGVAAVGGVDAGRFWPRSGSVLVVARTSTNGLEWARDLAREHASGIAGIDVQLVGVVLLADAPGRLPGRIRALADLVGGAFAQRWQVPWLPEWRLAAATEPLPVHPRVAGLIRDVHALTAAGPARASTAS